MFSPDDALGSILVKSAELGGHVGKRSQTIGVEILILLRMETQTNAPLLQLCKHLRFPRWCAGLPSSGSCWTGWCGWPPGWANCRGRSPSVTSPSTTWCSSAPGKRRGTQTASGKLTPGGGIMTRCNGNTYYRWRKRLSVCVYPPPHGWNDWKYHPLWEWAE